ncbi:host attachment family protein [Sphingobium lignivorans]|uniref:Protein required for attachment to host cells n=1 Tax=Sphingobium lignivorans TaxID=2735886 RepID=A0ABR6NEW0_9SPHN|nr:host attachment family protein [Sphingobium lignivorans]MBB5985815.1 protein required for attachment to host cells [Sphingobium lignivorans]
MKIDHGTLVAVMDGKKMLLFRNEGDETYPNLVLEQEREQDNPPGHEQGTDAPGRAFSSVGPGRSAMEETDFHRLAEDRFADEAAAILNKRALANAFDKLIIVAPPKTLGELRGHYHKELESRLVGEVAKDLTGHPVPDIERIVSES